MTGSTRPDLAYAVGVLARKQTDPTGKLSKISFVPERHNHHRARTDVLEATTDASFRDLPNSASTSGYIITLFGNPVSWWSHKQYDYVHTSTGCNEHIAMSEACPELISLDKAIR